MATDLWVLNMNLCRCCHAEGKFKQLSRLSSYLEENEIYLDLLKDCFNIILEPAPGSLYDTTYTICEACIIRLKDANEFKKQVVTCEDKFKSMLAAEKVTIGVSSVCTQIDITVKAEPESLLEDPDYNEDDFDEELDWEGMKEEKPTIKKENKGKKKVKNIKEKKKAKATKKEIDEEKDETDDAPKEDKKRGLEPRFLLTEQDYRKDGDDYICLHCDAKYDKKTSLRYHIRVKHHKIPRYICICGKEFMTPAPFTTHKLEQHGIDDRFRCNACKGVFNTQVQLRKHKNIFHMLGQKLKCEFCEYETFSLEGMYKHKYKHKTVKDFHCRFCKKSFLRRATLELHERIHTGDRRKVCSVCGQAFVQKASLNYHMTKYHPEVNF